MEERSSPTPTTSTGEGTKTRGRGRRKVARNKISSDRGGQPRRSRGRGTTFINQSEVRRQQEARRDERDQNLQNMIESMDVVEMRQLLKTLVERQPGLFFDIWETRSRPPAPTPPVTNNQPNWCTCSRCGNMTDVLEQVCCTGTPDDCLSIQPVLAAVVLDPLVLGVAQGMRNDAFGLDGDHADPNKALRHAAYRQFVLWQYGRLVRGDRRVIPSCVVLKIRNSFPDRNGQYTGYVPARLV